MTAVPKPAYGTTDLTGRRLGRYEVLNLLASGGMATVYVARAQGVAGFERLVAIKVLHPHLAHDEDFISMFLDEARLAARIRHPNAVGTLDISDTQGDGYFLVMEYVEGDHFGALLRNAAKGGERLPVPVVARVVMDALAGLHAAHRLTDATGAQLDLVHRDVSPHNILVGGDGVARITDFGVAKAQVRLSSTRDGQFKGKLSYMAPEQAASGQADQRSDLFSMGIVLWEALTGRRLFRGENNADVLNKILNPAVPPPSSFEPTLAPFDAVITKALAKEADDRFQSADEFLEAIEEAAADCGGVATPRAVGRTVKTWLGDKIEAERVQIRDAIDALGRSELTPGVLPRPMDSGSQPSHPQNSRVRPITPDDATMGAKPSTRSYSEVTALPETGKKSPLLWLAVGALIVLLFAGGGGAAWALLGDDAEVDVLPPAAAGEPAQTQPTDEPGARAADVETERAAEADAPVDPSPAADEEAAEEADDSDDRAEAEDDSDSAAARRRRARRQRRAREREAAAQETEPPAQRTPSAQQRGGEDDDLMLNPYRR
ncbi:MAG: hypothetical protein SangKO_074520 [Sandaracinaceae bacterium]